MIILKTACCRYRMLNRFIEAFLNTCQFIYGNKHDKYYMSCCAKKHKNNLGFASGKDPDQLGHLPSLIRFFNVCVKKAKTISSPVLEHSEDSHQTWQISVLLGKMPKS